ncbi:unnamed protein product, partial [Didymodactylos carnosus]
MLHVRTDFFKRQDATANSQHPSSQQQTHPLFSANRRYASNLNLPTVSTPRTCVTSEISIDRMNHPYQNLYDRRNNPMSIQHSTTTTPVVVRLSRSSSSHSNSPYIPITNTAIVNNNNIASHQHKKFSSNRLLKEAQLLLRRSWPNPFVQGRSPFIFLVGVALSISHAIIPEEEQQGFKHLAEVYFTFLYWLSIFWMLFFIFDIVRHRRKINLNSNKSKIGSHLNINGPVGRGDIFKAIAKTTPYFDLKLFDDVKLDETQENNLSLSDQHTDDDDNGGELEKSLEDVSSPIKQTVHYQRSRNTDDRRLALDKGGISNLRAYIRHRKDSIVQRVIGYNYDDKSTAGGLYIRVGTG